MYKVGLNLKLSDVPYSSAVNTYEDILACLREAAGEALEHLPEAKNKQRKILL